MNLRKILLASAFFGIATSALAQQPGVNSPYNAVFGIPIDNKAPTYSASIAALAAASSATDIFTLCGNATNVVRISQVQVSGRATSAAAVDVSLILRSTADSAGTATTPTPVKFDSRYATAVSVARAYTANPTLGTTVGGPGTLMETRQLFLGNLTTGEPGAPVVWTFGNRPSSQIVLRGVAQCLAVNLNAATNSGNVFDVSVEWTEFGL